MSQASPAPQHGRRLAVAVSGSGRSLENFMAQENAEHGYQLAAVIASRPDCRAVDVARQRALPTFVARFDHDQLEAAASSLYPWLEAEGIDWIALAGFLRPFPVAPGWRERIVNIHPALLPDFGGRGMYGERVHRAVIAAGASLSGATVHYVNERYDEGRAIAQMAVKVLPEDSPETLAARVFAAESKLYPLVVNQLIAGELPLKDGSVLLLKNEP